jgi:hypothetical protein
VETRERKQGLGRDKEETRKRTRKRKQGRGNKEEEETRMKGLPSVPFPRHYCTVQQSIQQSIQLINSAINTTIKQQSIRKSWCPCFHSNLNLSLSLSSYLFQLPRRRHFPECFPPQRTLGNLRSKTEGEEWGGRTTAGRKKRRKKTERRKERRKKERKTGFDLC